MNGNGTRRQYPPKQSLPPYHSLPTGEDTTLLDIPDATALEQSPVEPIPDAYFKAGERNRGRDYYGLGNQQGPFETAAKPPAFLQEGMEEAMPPDRPQPIDWSKQQSQVDFSEASVIKNEAPALGAQAAESVASKAAPEALGIGGEALGVGLGVGGAEIGKKAIEGIGGLLKTPTGSFHEFQTGGGSPSGNDAYAQAMLQAIQQVGNIKSRM